MSNLEDNTARRYDGGFDTDAFDAAGNEAATAQVPRIEDDLKGILNLIAAQIADADRRHSQVLEVLAGRLEAIGTAAQSTKSKIPAAYAAAFERIQDGIALLAERIAEGGSSADGADVRLASEPAPTAAEATPARAPAAAETSAPPGSTSSDRSEPVPAPATIAGGTTESFASLPGDIDEPWDRQSAEALTQLYEAELPAVLAGPIHDTARVARDGVSSAALFAHRHDTTGSSATRLADEERQWLEERFAEIAAAIEQSLAQRGDESVLVELADRFGQFETRLGSTLAQVATRADLDGIRQAEEQIAAMLAHVGETEARLARLDGVEAQIETLMDRLTDDRVLSASGVHQAADVEAVARAAAEAALAQFADSGLAADATSIADLRQSVEAFMAERRTSDETTVAMLETMQHAMLSVLDRLEQLEAGSFAGGDTVTDAIDEAAAAVLPGYAPSAPTTHFAEADAGDDDDEHPLARHAPVRHAQAVEEPPALPPVDLKGQAPGGHVPGLAEAETYRDAPAYGMAGQLADRSTASYPATSETVLAAGDAAGVAQSAIDRLRAEFIADAQRAKLKVSEAQASAKPAGKGVGAEKTARVALPQLSLPGLADIKAAALKSLKGKSAAAAAESAGSDPLAALRPGAGTAAAAGKRVPINEAPGGAARGKGSMMGGARRKVLIGAVIILFATAGALMMLRGKARTAVPAPAAGIEQPLGSQAEPAGAAPAPGDRSDVLEHSYPYDEPAGEGERRVADLPSGVAIVGGDQPVSVSELERVRQRLAMAEASSDLGAAAAYATPASLLPEYGTGAGSTTVNGVTQSQPQAVAAFGPANSLELPPASVGPLSLRLAAAKGDPSAQFEVGARLAEGKGTAQDFKSAIGWYEKAAGQGFAQAQYRLGTFHERGLGVAKDFAKARSWYTQAAEAGNVKAMHNLAVLSAGNGAGSPNYGLAAKWFKAAADRGLADSQFNLAVLYDNGLGVEKDKVQAFVNYALAGKAGDKEAVRRRDALKGEMSVVDIASAEALVAKWRALPTDKVANDPRAAGEEWKKNADNGYSG